ncbi:hypothetical protein [Bacteroides sp.]|uniref:hypothetical protein n=1 Tax=Bacteroides sp. TaxID=29523 RepID=UPI00261B3B2A|nr:hypothetical protein [Bacteroides sp.]MDD3037946.1 hypothetical protein [Bacteroides sp.]
MGNYKGSINLMQLMGAKVVSMEVNGKPMNCVCIPVGWNDIAVTADKTTNEPNGAFLNLRGWETGANFRKACEERNTDKEGYVAPSHQISVSYTESFQEAAQKSAEARLRNNAEFMKNNPTDDDIKKQAKYDVSNKSRVGTLTPLERQQPTAYAGQSPAAQVAGQWTPPTVDAEGHVIPGDDLPF